MARLVRWDPFRDVLSLRDEMDRLLQRGWSEETFSGQWAPPLDLYEEDDRFVIKLDLPGMHSENIEVTLDQNLLSIRGERMFEDEAKQESYHRIERRYGSFARSVSLPAQVDADAIQAEFTDGVLTVTVPKAETAKPRKIKIGEGARQLNA